MKQIRIISLFVALPVIFFVLGELALRLVKYPRVLLIDEIEANNQSFIKAAEYQKFYKFNNLNLRGEKNIGLKSQNIYRIVCLGDSWTFGLNVREEKSYPAQLQAYLADQGLEQAVEVINAGYPGFTLEDMHKFIAGNLTVLNPDCLLILIGMNNISMKNKNQPSGENFIVSVNTKISNLAARSHVGNVLGRAIRPVIRIAARIFRDDKPLKELYVFLHSLRDKKTEVIILNYPLPRRQRGILRIADEQDHNPDQDRIPSFLLGKDARFGFIDLFTKFKAMKNNNSLFLDLYHTHLNEQGYGVMAEAIGDYILKDHYLSIH